MSTASQRQQATLPYPQLDWLADETLFSLCSRQHLVIGNVSASTTSVLILGLTHRGIKHDLPYGLKTLQTSAFQRWGNVETLLFQHTILPIFVPFQSQLNIGKAVETLKGNQIGSLKYSLGLVAGGFGAEHPLKACPECMREDRNACGVAYWHLTHQYPGIFICPVHQAWLMTSTTSRRWSGRFSWSLPNDDTLAPLSSSQTSWSSSAFLHLANAVIALASIGRRRVTFDAAAVVATYRATLPQQNRSVSFLNHIAPLRRFHLFESLPASEESAASFINQLVRTPRRNLHPLKHLAFITWLFRDLQAFEESYHAELTKLNRPAANNPCPEIEDVDCSPPAAIVPKGPARPKRLKAQMRQLLLSELQNGAPKHQLCAQFQITISTVNKLLRAEPQTSAIALEARNLRAVDDHRRQWTLLYHQYPGLGMKALRAKAPATYAWIYRNDKVWLTAQAQKFNRPARTTNPNVDWVARDHRLLVSIRDALRSISDLELNNLTRAQLYALVPSIPTCLEKRDRYPLSRAYLVTVLKL